MTKDRSANGRRVGNGSPTRFEKARTWAIDLVVGVGLGGFAGVVVALNIAIFSGADQGYESSIGELFQHSPLAGVLALVALLACPVIGVWLARRHRHRK